MRLLPRYVKRRFFPCLPNLTPVGNDTIFCTFPHGGDIPHRLDHVALAAWPKQGTPLEERNLPLPISWSVDIGAREVEHHFDAPISRLPFPLWQEMSRSLQHPEPVYIVSKEPTRGNLPMEQRIAFFHRQLT
jgi:hypothetical protein